MPDHPSWPAELVEKARRAINENVAERTLRRAQIGQPDAEEHIARAVLSALSGDLVPREEQEPSQRTWDGETCQSCGGEVAASCPTWWYADDALWREVTGEEEGIRCIPCFTREAQEEGICVKWAPVVDARFDGGQWVEEPAPSQQAVVLTDDHEVCDGQLSEARSQADALAEALERIVNRDWKPVTVTDGGRPVVTVSVPDIIVAQEVARSALASYRSSSSTETEDRA